MGKIYTLFNLLPKLHKVIVSLIILFSIFMLLLSNDKASASKQTISNNKIIPHNPNLADTTIIRSEPIKARSLNANNKNDEMAPPIAPQPLPQPITISSSFTVKSGDTLAKIFQQANLSARDLYDVSQAPLAQMYLLQLMPKDQITIIQDPTKKLISIRKNIDPLTTLVINKENDKYIGKIETKKVDIKTDFATGIIHSNFWHAAIDAKMTPAQIMELATIFGWDIDFALDLRKGDSFSILYQKKYTDNKFIQNGHILAAEFINQGDKYTAVRYKDGQYYSKDGRSMRKAFLRSPVDFKYVSSNFNPRRIHPVTGTIKAHRGVDYVAPIGTPIKAAGNGRVIESGYNKYNGNYIFIKHNTTYTTKYLHLTKRKVKNGQTVKQGDIIGTLGKTGRVTGAHLHYEFIVNGVHRNPRTIKLPTASPIAAKEKANFANLSQQLFKTLTDNKQTQLAFKE